MIPQDKYVSLLKCKAGEFIALNKLPDNLKDGIVRVADLVANPQKKRENHIRSFKVK